MLHDRGLLLVVATRIVVGTLSETNSDGECLRDAVVLCIRDRPLQLNASLRDVCAILVICLENFRLLGGELKRLSKPLVSVLVVDDRLLGRHKLLVLSLLILGQADASLRDDGLVLCSRLLLHLLE